MAKVLVHSGSYLDASSFYRCLGPLRSLEKTMDLEIVISDSINWQVMKSIDLVFLHRPSDTNALAVLNAALLFNKPIIVDFDDNYFEIPEHNPAHEYLATKKTLEIAKACIANCTQLWVSTEELKNQLWSYANNLRVIPNALDDSFLTITPKADYNKVILWRGSPTHEQDLLSIKKDLIGLSLDSPWPLVFVGKIPYELKKGLNIDNCRFIPFTNTVDSYFSLLARLKPGITLVPLEDNLFNQGKSNIAWIESTWAGSAVIASDLPEFQLDTIVNPDTNFYETTLSLIADIESRNTYRELSCSYIKENLLLSKVNELRKIAILELLGIK